ncbi:hypothetical protein HBB16_08510 [Pseudonocardia sp. MCCB 268]|nr:hypothetical protein [Pseudonocardia cytotoxica]
MVAARCRAPDAAPAVRARAVGLRPRGAPRQRQGRSRTAPPAGGRALPFIDVARNLRLGPGSPPARWSRTQSRPHAS